MKKTLCPFSKPIIGNWCHCQHANMNERCAGKMTCLQGDRYIAGCYELVNLFKEKSKFVLGVTHPEDELTHMQLMKIRCGGLLGMQRILSAENTGTEIPDVLTTMELAKQRYGTIADFPFSEIVRDIKDFRHRQKRNR